MNYSSSELFTSNGGAFCMPEIIFSNLLTLGIFAVIGIILLATLSSLTQKWDHETKVDTKRDLPLISLVYKDLPLSNRENVPKIFIYDRADLSGNNLFRLCWDKHYLPSSHEGVGGYRVNRREDRFSVVDGISATNINVTIPNYTSLRNEGFAIVSRSLPIIPVPTNRGTFNLAVKKD